MKHPERGTDSLLRPAERPDTAHSTEGALGTIRTWFLETRPQFLVISPVLIFLGTAIALYQGHFDPLYAGLALVGMVLVHMSVNTLNDYFDFRSGIDLEVSRTPFSGGSGILAAGLLAPASVRRFGVICFLLAVPIAVFFVVVRGWLLIPILIAGAICLALYTTHLSRWGLGELAAGLGLGSLPVLGAYVVQTGTYSWEALIGVVPSGVLLYTGLLLFEFPDMEPDRKAGKRTFPVLIGKDRSALLYSVLIIVLYAWIIAWSVAGFMPLLALLALLTVPLAVRAMAGALNHGEEDRFFRGLKANLTVLLGVQVLLAVGYVIAAVI